MKHTICSRILAAFCCICMILAVAGCKSDQNSGKTASGDDIFKNSNNGNSDGGTTVSDISTSGKYSIDLKGKTCTILENTEDPVLIDLFKKTCNGELKYMIVNYSEKKMKLAELVMSGKAPDIYCVGNQDYPTVAIRDLLQPLEGLFKFKSKNWSDMKSLLDDYAYNNHYFVMPHDFSMVEGLWWNTKVFEDLGIKETPDTYMASDTWDWKALEKAALATTSEKNGISGYAHNVNATWSYMSESGLNLVSLTADGLVNNTSDQKIAKAMEAYSTITCSAAYSKTTAPLKDLANGKLAMYIGNLSDAGNEEISKLVSNGVIKLAHLPKMTGESEYRYTGYYGGYGIPKSVTDTDAAVAFMNMYHSYKSDIISAERTRLNYTKNMIEISDQAKHFVPNLALGISEVLQSTETMGVELDKGIPWSTIKKKYDGKVQAALDSLGS